MTAKIYRTPEEIRRQITTRKENIVAYEAAKASGSTMMPYDAWIEFEQEMLKALQGLYSASLLPEPTKFCLCINLKFPLKPKVQNWLKQALLIISK